MKTNLTYREFLSWYKSRTKDNAWTLCTFLVCYDVRRKMKKTPLWKRRQTWLLLCRQNNIAEAVNRTKP